jgi:outer membrane protein assembly factor BamB
VADGRIYLCSHEGKTTVVRPNPERYEELAENQLDGLLMASPIASQGALFMRSDHYLYRLEAK